MDHNHFLLLNIAALVFLLIILLSFELSLFNKAISVAIIGISVYNILRYTLWDRISFFKGKPRFTEKPERIKRFEETVRRAYEESVTEQAEQSKRDDYYWNKSYTRQPEQFEELRRTPLSQEFNSSISKREISSFRDEGSSAKKVRTYFMEKKQDSNPSQQTKAAIQKAIQTFFAKELIKNATKKFELNKNQVDNCVKVMNEFISSKIENQLDAIIEDFEAIDKFLNRCFSFSLTLQRPQSASMVTYREFIEMMQIIEKKKVIPPNFTTNFSLFEVTQKLNDVKKHINRLPNFSLPPNVLKLCIASKYLCKEFPNANIILSDFTKTDTPKQGPKHIIRMQDSQRFFYHNQPHIKTKQVSVILLLLVIHLFKDYQRSSKYLIKQLSMQLGYKPQ